jgi:nucleotide-binding universal stress UspA family protein
MKLMTLIDGSNYSASVCDHSAWVVDNTGAEVALIHVLEHKDVSNSIDNLSGSIGLGARSELLEELAEHDAQKARLAQKCGRAILEDAKSRLTDAGVKVVSSQLRHGEIVETVEDFEANLIVIGKRGESAGLNKLHLGSNLERVVRSSHRPVLVASRAFKPINSALVAFDGGNSVKLAIDYMVEHPAFNGIECTLLAVNAQGDTAEKLDQAANRLRSAGYSMTTKIESGQVESIIAKAIENDGHDLLIMGAYGHSRIRSLIIGSTTTEMVRSCHVPVLLFR